VVEGARRAALLDYTRNDTLQVAEHLYGRNSHRREAEPRYRNVTRHVLLRRIAAIVRFPIHLHRKSRVQAREIERERVLRILATELEPAGSLTQRTP